MLDPASAAALYPPGLDAHERLRIFVDSYGVSLQERTELPDIIEQTTAACRAFAADRVADGDPTYVKSDADCCGWQRWDRIRGWLTANREAFSAALQD
ncbi:hypothetical protein [Streptomyces sp. NPDC048248]|uniref:hypothetical protein n=1 Tax=Streptomyces sp. NPDC048248 TaxID=3365523 RepID=UPI0037174093